MQKYLDALKGKKTYIVAAGMVLYAILGIVLGQITPDQGVLLILQGLGFAGLRHGIKK